MDRRIINPWTWQDQMGFVQANDLRGAERWLICSGQTSMDADGNPLHAGDMNAQLVQALDNLETVLHAANFEMSDIVRLNVYTTDIDRFMQALPAVGERLQAAGCRFTSTLLGVSRLAFPDLLVEIEATVAS